MFEIVLSLAVLLSLAASGFLIWQWYESKQKVSDLSKKEADNYLNNQRQLNRITALEAHVIAIDAKQLLLIKAVPLPNDEPPAPVIEYTLRQQIHQVLDKALGKGDENLLVQFILQQMQTFDALTSQRSEPAPDPHQESVASIAAAAAS